MISNLKKSIMGTLQFSARFNGMRKAQEFIVYPLHAGNPALRLTIQSDTRIGYVYLEDGRVMLCPPVSSGAYNPHLALVAHADTLTAEELVLLKAHVLTTAGKSVGDNGIMTTDNSGALAVFGSGLDAEPQ